VIITVDILKQIEPGSKKTNYKHLEMLAVWMNYYVPKFEIDQKGEYCHFLAQAAHESDSFNALEEYASGDAYDTRVDLGNTPQKDGDGRKYKGRGLFQVTGLINYKQATLEWKKWTSIDGGTQFSFKDQPELLARPQFAVWSACQYWDQRNFNNIANMPDTTVLPYKIKGKIYQVSPVEYISRKINGGINGLPERIKFYERAKQCIS
jgi:putative chitinase